MGTAIEDARKDQEKAPRCFQLVIPIGSSIAGIADSLTAALDNKVVLTVKNADDVDPALPVIVAFNQNQRITGKVREIAGDLDKIIQRKADFILLAIYLQAEKAATVDSIQYGDKERQVLNIYSKISFSVRRVSFTDPAVCALNQVCLSRLQAL